MISRHNFQRSRKGIGTIFGMVFFLLIVMIVFASFIILLNKNTGLEQTIIQTTKMDNEAAREQARIFTANNNTQFLTNVLPTSVTVSCKINNTGTVPIQLMRVWVEDQSTPTPTTGSAPIPSAQSIIQQGQAKTYQITVSINISNISKTIFWFVTARGNLFNQYTNQGPAGPVGPAGQNANSNNALTAQGIGSISMDFSSFTHYELGSSNPNNKNLTTIGIYSSNFTITSSGYTVLHAVLMNVDPLNQTIWLNGNSTIYILGSHSGTVKYGYWSILNVTNGVVGTNLPVQYVLPPFTSANPVRVDVYFINSGLGQIDASSSASVYPLNIELFGRKGYNFGQSSEYGQNIPFEPIYVR